jgi:hypothetical protein
MTDTQFVQNILNASAGYQNDFPYSVPSFSPGYMPPGEYNSNSYVSGVLKAAGAAIPSLNTGGKFQAPGYGNPLPFGGSNASKRS